jgi:hypothetical protein
VLASASANALADARDLLGVDDGIQRGEVVAILGAGGDEEVIGNVEESRGAGPLPVATGLRQEVTVEQVANHGVGVHAANLVDAGAR